MIVRARVRRRFHRYVRRSLGRYLSASVLIGTALLGRPASAWDPSTTHVAMTQRAVLQSQLHVRWMDQSGLTRGVFSAIRLHPDDLDPQLRRMLTVALRRVHEASGAAPLGGPGACPGASAPPSTQARCVDGDVWELDALGWLKLGVALETAPRTRLLHHFASATDPAAATWADPELPAAVLRAKARRAEGALARAANRSAFSGGATSAVGWLSDAEDPWAPPATVDHLRQASLAPDARTRDRELALGLLGLGALLHVVQDQSVPAHARGDLTAFFAPLSPTRGDRGLPLQEYARALYGRVTLPGTLSLSPRDTQRSAPLAPTLHQHLLGYGEYQGLTRFAATNFWSESSLPAPKALDTSLSATDAAAALIGEGAGLAEAELDGAELSPWPAPQGYLRSGTGRGLAAFDTDEEGRIRLFLDRRVYRDQAAHLIPAGIEASASVLDLLFPAFPDTTVDFEAGIIDIDLREGLHAPVLTVLVEDETGLRTPLQRIALRAGERNHIVDAFQTPLPENRRLLLSLEGATAPEHGLSLATSFEPVPPAAAMTVPTAATAEPAAAPAESNVPGASSGAPGTLPSTTTDGVGTQGPSQGELIAPFPAKRTAAPKADAAGN